MVTRQRLRVGRTYAGKIVTIDVEDTHLQVTCDGVQLALHPRHEQRPVTRWKAKIHTALTGPVQDVLRLSTCPENKKSGPPAKSLVPSHCIPTAGHILKPIDHGGYPPRALH